MPTFHPNQGGELDKALRQILDQLFRAADRRWTTQPDDVARLVERCRLEEVRAALAAALAFCHQFCERSAIPEPPVASRRILTAFLCEFNEAMPPDRQLSASWPEFVRFLRLELARKRILNRFRHWLMLPRRLFAAAQAEAEKSPDYRSRAGQLPPWWPKATDRKWHDATLDCWLKDCQGHGRWQRHCWSGCVLQFLKEHRFTRAEISGSLRCGDCRAGFSYCSADRRATGGNDAGCMDGSPSDKLEPDDSRPKAAAEQRRRAEEFARHEVSDENLPALVEVLFTPPAGPTRQPVRLSWGDLVPEMRIRILSSVAAVGACLAVLLAVVVLPGTSARTLAMASVVARDPGAPAAQQRLLALIQEPLAVAFDARRRRLEFTLSPGGRLRVPLMPAAASTPFQSTLMGTNQIAVTGGEVTVIIQWTVQPSLEQIDRGAALTGATLDLLLADGTTSVALRLLPTTNP